MEGLNDKNIANLRPIQEPFADGATQCGFCTPDFIMSVTS